MGLCGTFLSTAAIFFQSAGAGNGVGGSQGSWSWEVNYESEGHSITVLIGHQAPDSCWQRMVQLQFIKNTASLLHAYRVLQCQCRVVTLDPVEDPTMKDPGNDLPVT